MLINLSNHPSDKWSEAQTAAAAEFGEIIDLPFPAVDADGDESYIDSLADEYAQKVESLADNKQATIHLMGEMTLTFALVKRLVSKGITCIASTSQRIVVDKGEGQKEVLFQFVKFRRYE